MDSEPLIGKNIVAARERKGWLQKHLADVTGISPSALCSYENGHNTPGLQTLAKIAKALGVSIDSLYFGDESIPTITHRESDGRAAALALFKLHQLGILGIPIDQELEGADYQRFCFTGVHIPSCFNSVKRFLNRLEEFNNTASTYPDADEYLRQLIGSVANQLEKELRW